ncbi:uncharacterized protein LOC113318161 isoform X4 [Papaver somniferum]|uniref:uncharacterized protein LOC113318161 isoform X4 n=1 Tax=Papaver somniferum TaxID=3469 RepID=UPI000E6F80CA|nr:uncharacterized protein LOC113318161 isoform X4 [Papaver somniferum]
MPGPGPHTMYTIGSGVGLMSLSQGRFSPQHCIIYATNAFLGPDLGSFSEWLTSTIGFGHNLGSLIMDTIHHPFYYILILGFPLSFFYSWISRIFLQKGILDSISGENGHSSMYTWILSTGWWKGRAPVNMDSIVVVGSLCTCLFGGFIYINRVKQSKSFRTQWVRSVKLILVIASLYCVWCASQLYLRNPPQPAVGEEVDLGVIVFLVIYLFLPHSLCIMSMNPKDNHLDTTELPL